MLIYDPVIEKLKGKRFLGHSAVWNCHKHTWLVAIVLQMRIFQTLCWNLQQRQQPSSNTNDEITIANIILLFV